MKLSEAIRLGAMLKPQAFSGAQWPEKSCALQAACDALGMDGTDVMPFLAKYPWAHRKVTCPACNVMDKPRAIHCVIAFHLNDDHRWTREQIADWVATIEPQDAPESTPATQEALCSPA